MLQIRDVSKSYRKTVAVNHVNLHLAPGSLTVLLGPNGAGKSTLLKSVVGFLRYQGEIFIGGLPNKGVDAKRLVGFVPEMPSLYPNLTVIEHMELIARAYKLTNYQEDCRQLLTLFELDDKQKKFGDELSKGMQQKLSICLGLLPKPRLLLLDEPMVGLDPHAIKSLKELLLQKRNEGCAILISTHIIDSIEQLWDRCVIMQTGQVRADVTRETLWQSGQTLEQLFFAITEGSPEGGPSNGPQNGQFFNHMPPDMGGYMGGPPQGGPPNGPQGERPTGSEAPPAGGEGQA